MTPANASILIHENARSRLMVPAQAASSRDKLFEAHRDAMLLGDEIRFFESSQFPAAGPARRSAGVDLKMAPFASMSPASSPFGPSPNARPRVTRLGKTIER